jgi:large subunit ribosomal protein L1|tara:strand:+ start:2063 stop:2752 length:690 start_codon:yes stop_codon:yes gene_type:complete
MQKISTRQKNLQTKITEPYYEINDAIDLLKETATAKFVESAELHVNLNIDPKYADQQLRTTIVLPYGTGKTKQIAVLANEANLSEIESTLPDIICDSNLIADITKGVINFDLLIATPEMMPKLAKLGRVLGPKGLMPSPKAGTVTTNLLETIVEFKKGKFEYKTDKTGIVHINFGKSNFTKLELEENVGTLLQSIQQNRPSGVKGKYFKSIFICTTMGPSIPLDVTKFN